MKFRNTYEAFDGVLSVNKTENNHELSLCWKKDNYETTLNANLLTYTFTVTYKDELGKVQYLSLG